MADYYTQFSVSIELTEEQSTGALSTFTACTDAAAGIDCGLLVPDNLKRFVDDGEFTFECEKLDDGLWLHDDAGCADLEAVASFIQHLLQQYDPKGKVVVTYAYTCSRPRIDAFSGGACIVTADDTHWLSIDEWVDETLSKINNESK